MAPSPRHPARGILHAARISLGVRRALRRGVMPDRVVSCFDHALNLACGDGPVVVALVSRAAGIGPFHVVLEAQGSLPHLHAGTRITCSLRGARAGTLTVDWADAHPWEPRPPWGRLRRWGQRADGRMRDLLALAVESAPEPGLLPLVAPWLDRQPRGAHERLLRAAHPAAEALRSGVAGDLERARRGAEALAGLGPGATPAGDDFLVGALAWTWLRHPHPGPVCEAIAAAAVPRTTALAAAFLRSAADGELTEPWHRLLGALTDARGAELAGAVADVVRAGATSGADTLAGWLWMATGQRRADA